MCFLPSAHVQRPSIRSNSSTCWPSKCYPSCSLLSTCHGGTARVIVSTEVSLSPANCFIHSFNRSFIRSSVRPSVSWFLHSFFSSWFVYSFAYSIFLLFVQIDVFILLWPIDSLVKKPPNLRRSLHGLTTPRRVILEVLATEILKVEWGFLLLAQLEMWRQNFCK